MTIYTARQFSVDTTGAYVTELCDAQGRAVIFARQMIDGRVRGGSHVCLPYFGPDQAGTLPQHGFGRTVEWRVKVSDDQRTVVCAYDEMTSSLFAGVSARIEYRLNEAGNEFAMMLSVTNNADQPRAVMPGFHPYFAVDSTDVWLNGQRIELADFEPFRSYPGTNEMVVETGERMVTIASDHLTYMVAWSDARGEYLCVEPTRCGNGFDSSGATPQEMLLPGQTAEYGVTIGWTKQP